MSWTKAKRTFLGIIAVMVAGVFVCSSAGMAGIVSNDHLRPNSAASTEQVDVLENDLQQKADGGTAVLSGLYVNGGQQAINSLIQKRDTQYMQAVRSVGSANLVVLPKEGKFAFGHDLIEQLKKNGMSCIAVNIVSYNEIEGHLRAAMANNSAIIFEVARSQIGYAIDEVKVAEYTLAIAKKIGCNIPIVLHGDHIQYGQELFEQATLLKDAYEAVNGKGSFKTQINVNDIDKAILKSVQDKLKENAAKERKDVTAIIERLIKAGFTSIAIDASTLYDERAGDIVTNYYKTKGTDEEKLVMKLMEAFVLQPEWGIDFLKYDPANEGTQFERIKNEVVGEMQKRNRAQNEIDAIVKDMEVAFGALTAEAKKNGLDPKAVIAAYDKIATDIAGATVGGKISASILATVSAKEKMLLLPTSNLAETAFQLKMIDELVKKYNPELLGHMGKEIEVGHVDKKVPNPRRGGKLEAQMTHPAAIKVMMDGLEALGLTFDIVAFNNGSGHGTDYDKNSLTPVSQVGKISPYLTADFARMLGDKAGAAQHGTSGSDMDELNVLSKAGVVKFNIATNNQQTQLNVHFLMHNGLRGVNLIKEIEANPQKYVEGLSEEVRTAMKQMAEGLKNGQIKESIDEKDSSFVRFIKLTYAWGKKKSKIKETSSKEDIALVFAKEFKRAFKEMDQMLVAIGKLNLIKRIAILTSGGPASGHNNVIYAAFLEAQAQGIELIVIWEGWKGLMKDSLVAKSRPLTLAEVEAERFNGGTILLTSRENPYSEEDIALGTPKKVWENIQKLQLDGLITLGGDDTNKVSYQLQNEHKEFPIIGGAKTMDGDIALLIPGAPNYGHSTFVGEGTSQVKKALVDYKSAKRIGVVEVFGRSAGFVTARIGAAVNAARSLIPEEKIDLEKLVKDMKAYKDKFGYGVVIVSEGVVIEKPETEKRMVAGPDGSMAEEEVVIETDPRILRNTEILKEALAKDDRARAAYEGKNVKKDKFGNPKLEDSGAIISAVLKWGGVSTSLTGKIDYAARSVPIDPVDEKITSLIGQSAVNKIATGEKNQLVYVDTPDIETMKAVSMEFIPKLGGRKMQIEEGGLDRATYLQGNQAMGMAQADGGSAVAATAQQNFNNVVELYKEMRRADRYERILQPDFIMLTPEQMDSVVWKLATFQEKNTDDWMWIRRILRKISPEQVDELKAMAQDKGLAKTLDLALMVDVRRAKEVIASRPAAVADGGSFKTIDTNMFNKMAQGFIGFMDSLKGVKSVKAGLIVEARAVIMNAGTAETLRNLKQASPDLAIVIRADTAIQVDQVKAMGLEDIASIELKELVSILSELNDQGISYDRIALIHAFDIIHSLKVAESALLMEKGVKVVSIESARNDRSVNSMPLVVAKAVTSVMKDQVAVVESYNKLTQSYRESGQISQEALRALNDLTSDFSSVPLVKVSEEVSKIQVAYEETVSKI